MKTPAEIATERVGNLGENTMTAAVADAVRATVHDMIVTAIEADRRQHTIVTALTEALDDREHPTAAAWLRENEDDDAVWGMVGNLLDEIERMSEGETR